VSTRGAAVCLGNLWQVKVRTQDCFAVSTFELLSDLTPVGPSWKSPQISGWSWERDKYKDWLITTAVHLFDLISHHVGIPFSAPQTISLRGFFVKRWLRQNAAYLLTGRWSRIQASTRALSRRSWDHPKTSACPLALATVAVSTRCRWSCPVRRCRAVD
jgi:hypothetical protein